MTTKKIVLIGGNGYIGRALTQAWVTADADIEVFVLSRSGKNQLQLPQIKNIVIDRHDVAAISAALPGKIDYIVDLVGGPEKDATLSKEVNDWPAELMQTLATEHQARAMGFIGGRLGPKYFLAKKQALIKQLQTSTIPLAYVEPTLVYGAGRDDAMAKMVGLLKVFGLVIPNLKPVKVTTVADELLTKLLQY
ncbi:UDP-glucose 4-epimerase [Lactiplantibacillus fabifermentans T30PCM01]|uniref:UDP-glucose 4-epimerase n=1 Tax=Lactiplantibacillus fabifermentans T30PCM01 TaxID=1400520 RepID=W6T3U1_9LACO|nr:NAD-dependent epimerase/dehydratase family protein [Lactiplantibacillus fabifermentans]ETY72527.1 UDP-glucose 4-epimerase [Lactiplantibacillus fabifermentans T30PCM01]